MALEGWQFDEGGLHGRIIRNLRIYAICVWIGFSMFSAIVNFYKRGQGQPAGWSPFAPAKKLEDFNAG
jgi:hypothetical protein